MQHLRLFRVFPVGRLSCGYPLFYDAPILYSGEEILVKFR